MDNWTKVIEWLSVGGAVSVVSWLVAWLLDDFAWWNALKPQYKKLLILAASVLIGVGAKYLQLHEELMVVLKPYLDATVLVVTAWLATQVAHKADKS